MILDGIIYVLIQMLTVLSTQFGTDETAKYVDPVSLFWIKVIIGELSAGVLALKMYRSESYSNWKNKLRNGNGNGSHALPPEPVKPKETP